MRALQVVFFTAAPTVVLALVLVAMRRRIADNWPSILFLAAACVLFFHRILFLPETISQSDANLLQVQFFDVYREAIRAHCEIPFWNPYQATGLPNLAHPLSAMFYPLTPIFLVGNIFKALDIFILCHYFLAGIFALLLGRRMFRTRPAALVFALLYVFNGWAITRAAHQPAIEYLFAYTWLPLVVLGFEKALDGRNLLSCVFSAGAGLAWMGIACPNFFIYAALLLGIAAVLRLGYLAAANRKNALAIGVFVIFSSAITACAFGAVELVGAIELSWLATTGRFGEIFPAGWRGRALSAWEMARLYVPYTPGRPFGVYYSPGLVALAAAGFAVYRAFRAKMHRALCSGAVVIMLTGAALLGKTFPYTMLCRALGVFARASLIPAGLLFLFLPVIVLAAAGVEALIESHRQLLGRRGWIIAGLVFAELFVVFGIVYPRWGRRRLTYNYCREVQDFPHLDEIVRLAPGGKAQWGDTGRLVVYGPPEGQILAPSYAVLARGLSRLNLHPSAFAPDWLTESVRDACENLSPEVLGTLGVGWLVSTEPLMGIQGEVEVPWPGVRDHYENSLFHPLRNSPGWLTWDKIVRLYRVCPSPALAHVEPAGDAASPTAGSGADPADPFGDVPLAEFDSWVPVTDVSQTTSTLVVNLVRPHGKRLFLAVTAYPGWQVRVDGAQAKWVPAGGAYMGVVIPEDTKRVELCFEPTRWGTSLAVSVAAFLFILVAAGLDLHFSRRASHTG